MSHKTKPQLNTERLIIDFNQLAAIGATVEGGVSRLALSNEDLEARAWLAEQFEQANLTVHDDDAGNLSGILRSKNPNARTLMIGSHLDTVPNGGRYDGSVGIIGALECVRCLQEAKIELPFHLEIINFTDEEGCWQSLFGSRALTGTLNKDYTLTLNDDVGQFRAALFRAGIRPADVTRARRDPESIFGYLELHIEQSYILDDHKIDVGVVTAIVGRSTYQITFHGEASHSGTTRTADRRDALLGAAQFITEIHRTIRQQYPDGAVNCGNITVEPGAFNIIPSQACVTVECRHTDRDMLDSMQGDLEALARATSQQYGLEVEISCRVQMPAAVLSGQMILAAEEACQRVGVSYMRLQGLAGHDAQIMSNFTPTGMIFIPSVNGISHSPKEFTEWADVVKGVRVLLETVMVLAENVPRD